MKYLFRNSAVLLTALTLGALLASSPTATADRMPPEPQLEPEPQPGCVHSSWLECFECCSQAYGDGPLTNLCFEGYCAVEYDL